MQTERMLLPLSPQLKARLRVAADLRDMSVAAYIRMAAKKQLFLDVPEFEQQDAAEEQRLIALHATAGEI